MNQNRLISCQVLYQVCYKHQHIKQALRHTVPQHTPAQDRAWIQNSCYQTLRHYQNMRARWQKFTHKSVKDQMIDLLLTLSVTLKFVINDPDHAIVNEAVNSCQQMKKTWAKGLVNSVLKKTIQDDFQAQTLSQQHNHPEWWIERLQKDWPEHHLSLLQANNQKPPLWLRLSHAEVDKPAGQAHPHLPLAWCCDDSGSDISQALADGSVSVQDGAAQWAAHLLNPQAGERVLDACAAPGGKSCHLLQMQPEVILDILEKDPARMKLVEQNLERLNLKPHRMITGDASQPESWHTGEPYDAMLLDVPCSASGVVRRNPDMKVLRQAEHIKPLVDLQQAILQANARLLRPGGRLLYATCSVFKVENERQINRFLKSNPDFKVSAIDIPGSVDAKFGQQILTGTDQQDGFYYCMLERQA